MSSETPVPIDGAVSSLRSETARRNGSKSRGPKTAAGKRQSSQNSLTHGMYSSKIVLPNESQDDFDQLRNDYLAEFTPQGPAERHEVETMVVAEWRIRRFRYFETTSLRSIMNEDPKTCTTDVGAARAFFTDADEGRLGGVVGYYKFEPVCQRDYDRALRRLLDLQKRRNEPKRAESKAARNPEPPTPAGASPGSVSDIPAPPQPAVAASAPLRECAISHCTIPSKTVVEFHPMPPSHHREGESSPTRPDTPLLNSSKQIPTPWPEGCTSHRGILFNDQAKSHNRWK